MPEWTNVNIQEVLTGLWWLLVAVLGTIGVRVQLNRANGTTVPPPVPGERHVEVAGALIDNKRMDNLIDQIGLNTVALARKGEALIRNSEALDNHRSATERAMRQTDETGRLIERLVGEIRSLTEQNKDLRDEVRDLHGVISRQNAGR